MDFAFCFFFQSCTSRCLLKLGRIHIYQIRFSDTRLRNLFTKLFSQWFWKVCSDNDKFFRIPCTCVKSVIKNAEHERLNSEIFYTHHSVFAPVYKCDAFMVKEAYPPPPPPPNSYNANKPTERTVMDLEGYNLFHTIDPWLYWFHKWKKKVLFPSKGRKKTQNVWARQNRDRGRSKGKTDWRRDRERGKASVWRGFMSGACLLAVGLVPLWSTPL